jgi:hypothetical protein
MLSRSWHGESAWATHFSTSATVVGPRTGTLTRLKTGIPPATRSSDLVSWPSAARVAHDESKMACGAHWLAGLRALLGTEGSSSMITKRPTPHFGQRVAHRVSVTPPSKLRGVSNTRTSGDMTSCHRAL